MNAKQTSDLLSLTNDTLAMDCLVLIPLLGLTPFSIDYFATESGLLRRNVKHALEYLHRIGLARADRSVLCGTCYAKPE